jgi:hypothetical protein
MSACYNGRSFFDVERALQISSTLGELWAGAAAHAILPRLA